MFPSFTSGRTSELLLAGRKAAEEGGLGVAGSLLLHGAAALLILLFIARNASQPPQAPVHFVPVDLIRLGAETASPSEARKALVPQQKASIPREASSPTRASVSPTGTKPPPADALDAKLRALAKLRLPPSELKLADTPGVSNADAANGVPGDRAIYSVKDYVRAQVERRWSLNLARLGGRTYAIPIRIVMKRDGTIVSSDIVEQARTKTDAVYRDIALSAKNAAILSSPIVLPPGDYPAVMRFTLILDPKDTQR